MKLDYHNLTREQLAHATGLPASTLKGMKGLPRKKHPHVRGTSYDYWEVMAWLREQEKRASEAFDALMASGFKLPGGTA
jgi:hypothetical protein